MSKILEIILVKQGAYCDDAPASSNLELSNTTLKAKNETTAGSWPMVA
jgi:hypothetical protein